MPGLLGLLPRGFSGILPGQRAKPSAKGIFQQHLDGTGKVLWGAEVPGVQRAGSFGLRLASQSYVPVVHFAT